MTDEISIQQSQSNAGAYALGGATLGGIAGGFGAHYLTKPKYGSYEDIIKEARDSAEFSKKIEKAEGEEKTFLERVKALAAKEETSGAEWDKLLAEYQEAHKDGDVKKTPEFIELEKQQTECKNKVAELEKQAGKTTGTAAPKKIQSQSAIIQNTRKLNQAAEDLKELKANNAPKEAIDAAKKRIEKYQTRLNNAYDQIINGVEFKGTEDEIKKAKESFRAELEGYSQTYMREYDKFNSKQPENRYLTARTNMAREEKSITDALAKIKETTANGDFKGYDLAEMLSQDANKPGVTFTNFDKKFNVITKAEVSKAKVLQNLLDNFPKDAPNGINARQVLKDFFKSLFTGTDFTIGNADPQKAINDFINSLSPEAKKILDGKEVTKENIQQLLNESKERISTLNTAAGEIKRAAYSKRSLQLSLEKLEQEIMLQHKDEILKEVEGVKFDKKTNSFYKEVTQVSKTPDKYGHYTRKAKVRVPLTLKDTPFSYNADGELLKNGKKIGQAPQFKGPDFKPSKEFTDKGYKVPKEITIEKPQNAPQENAELKAAREELAKIDKQVEDARNNLPKGEAKTAEQLKADFIKEKGERQAFVDSAVKDAESSLKNDCKKWLERKWGFAEHTNWKIAGAAVAGAAVIGGLAALIAPKKDQA